MSLRAEKYDAVAEAILSLLEGETDWVATLATTACELHHEFDHFDWTGFYRVVAPEMMVIGPYQGTHGCQGYKARQIRAGGDQRPWMNLMASSRVATLVRNSPR